MGLSATPMRSLFKGEVRLAGDVQLARKFQRLFEKLDIDLQGKLARVAGDRVLIAWAISSAAANAGPAKACAPSG
ncbi:hypothetical protein [Methylomonas koyamae]|uniref:hypothetical protein n=1 Tax=Methylomonas koyamae TaxID=702114 RepID=UPI000AD0AFB4|nr:hypothetical protein [Methylomonas koyamae]